MQTLDRFKQKIASRLTFGKRLIPIIAVVSVVVAGAILAGASNASTASIFVEPEEGELAEAARVVNSDSASGKKAVLFGSSSTEGITAATNFGWGESDAGDEFTDPETVTDGFDWEVIHGVSNDLGTKDRGQVSVADGMLRIAGSKSGGVGGQVNYISDARKYGRWEVRERIPRGDSGWAPVHALWPNSGIWPEDGEINFRAGPAGHTPAGRPISYVLFLLHHSQIGNEGHTVEQKDGIDLREWHNYAVEWTPTHIRGFIDGIQWFESTDVSVFPPDKMFASMRLDWQGSDSGTTDALWEIDWLRIYDL